MESEPIDLQEFLENMAEGNFDQLVFAISKGYATKAVEDLGQPIDSEFRLINDTQCSTIENSQTT